MKKKGINFVHATCTKIDAEGNKIELDNGSSLDYDYLVITTGPRLAFEEIEDGKLCCDELDAQGNVAKQHEVDFKFAMMLPAFKGVDPVAEVQGLCNPRGFVTVDKYHRNGKYPNIYSAGVCIAIPPVEPTPVPTGTPKTGYMIESMVTSTVHNWQERPVSVVFLRRSLCILHFSAYTSDRSTSDEAEKAFRNCTEIHY